MKDNHLLHLSGVRLKSTRKTCVIVHAECGGRGQLKAQKAAARSKLRCGDAFPHTPNPFGHALNTPFTVKVVLLDLATDG